MKFTIFYFEMGTRVRDTTCPPSAAPKALAGGESKKFEIAWIYLILAKNS
jgi:hypothetical protein